MTVRRSSLLSESKMQLSSYRKSAHGVAVAVIALAATGVHAQSAAPAQTANPQSLQSPQQRVDRYYDTRRDDAAAPATDPLEAPASPTTPLDGTQDVRFELREVRFGPSAFLSATALDGVAGPYLGREVGIAELNAILDAANALYAERGITTARAVLSAQAIRDGVVQVDLVEGRLGALTVQGNTRTDAEFVRARVSQRDGEVVDTDALRRDLVYFNRTTDLRAQALLRAGAGVGSTDVLVNVTEPARRFVDVFADTAGVDSTGRERIGFRAYVNGLAGTSDRLAASFAYAQGGLEGQASYSWIVSRRNARLGASYTRSRISIINGAFRDLDIEGNSSAIGIDFVQPFKATQAWLVNGLATVSRAQSDTSISGRRIADTRSTVLSLGISAAHQAPGREWAVTQLVSSVAADTPIDGRDRFTLGVGNLTYIQRLGSTAWAMRGLAGWQLAADDALPASSLFQVGGTGSVRGYERGVLSGPRGYYANLELHRSFGEQWDVYGFADRGGVRGDYPTSADITGIGLGASWQRGWLSASVDLGHALDDVLADQDSTRIDLRITARWQ